MKMQIIKTKEHARQIISELEADGEGFYYRRVITYYDPQANGTGGTVSIWKDEDGNFWTYSSGRGWRDQVPTRKQDAYAAAEQLWLDRKLWNASERLRASPC